MYKDSRDIFLCNFAEMKASRSGSLVVLIVGFIRFYKLNVHLVV